MYLSDVTIASNYIHDGRSGIFVFLLSSSGVPASGNVFRDNTVIDAGRHGLGLTAKAHDNTFVGNQVSGSASGCDLFWNESGSGNCWKENTGTECPYPLPGR